MTLRYRLESLAQQLADFTFMLLPRPRPSRRPLKQCRLVSHRGEYDNRQVRENTLAAFRAVADAGIWGIELDLRWTRDLEPVVIHDPTTGRVYGDNLCVAELSLAALSRAIPEIPTLEQVVAEFGGRTHLMIELKPDRLDQDELKGARLAGIMQGLDAVRDYHFLALEADLFAPAAFAGPAACLLVAELEISAFSNEVVAREYGGLCGQYLLVNRRLIGRHHARGQRLGTGFVSSRFCFYRELNRDVDWIFTDHALKLNAIRERLLGRG